MRSADVGFYTFGHPGRFVASLSPVLECRLVCVPDLLADSSRLFLISSAPPGFIAPIHRLGVTL